MASGEVRISELSGETAVGISGEVPWNNPGGGANKTVKSDWDDIRMAMMEANPAAKMDRPTEQLIDNATNEKINLTDVVYEKGNISADTDNYRINIHEDGLYEIIGQWGAQGVDRGEQALARIYINGSVYWSDRRRSTAANMILTCSAITHVVLTSGEYVELIGYQNSDANQNTLTSITQRPKLAVCRIG